MKETVIISLGGSLIVPNIIDVSWLIDLKKVIEKFASTFRFIIVCGGGNTAREYQKAAKELCDIDKEDLDWLGIHSTRLNAHLLRTIFKDKAYAKIIKDPNEKIDFKEDILIAAGWKPGRSTDYIAVLLAEKYGIKKIINLTNIDFVYDKDPKKFKEAKSIKELSWTDFRKIVGDKWDPGLNSPFDPVASGLAQKLRLEVSILNGKNLENFQDCLNGQRFKGSVIKG